MRKLTQLSAVGLALTGMGHTAQATFLPESVLQMPPSHFVDFDEPRVTEVAFNNLIEALHELYDPIVSAHGAKLEIVNEWKSDTLNAFAEQSLNVDGERIFELHLFGGLARRSELDINGFAIIACHELGHHLAGFPFYDDDEWGASEGASDYYATQVCTKELWKKDIFANAIFGEEVHASAKTRCDAIYPEGNDRQLCYRSSVGSLQLGLLLAALTGDTVDPDGLDLSEVEETEVLHPASQCRLDTYVAGAVCNAVYSLAAVPGRGEDETTSNSMASQDEAALVSCMDASRYTDGLRPVCWFHALSEEDETIPDTAENQDKEETKEDTEAPGTGDELIVGYLYH